MPRVDFRHHNAYGYFLELGFSLLRPEGVLCAAVLRNFVDIIKYPQDAQFHVDLLRKFARAATPGRILLLEGNACVGLPYDFLKDKKRGIEMAIICYRASASEDMSQSQRRSQSESLARL